MSLFCYAFLCVHFSFAIILKRKIKLIVLLLLSKRCIVTRFKCSMALPHGAVSWSAVCDRGISRSYSLTFWETDILRIRYRHS